MNSYRADIDGLRAFAVLPVIAFHLRPDLVPGGYLGVDVFFVISGFLITSILLRQMDDSAFGFRAFWMRRMKRLFPAMAIVLTFTVLSGYFILFGDEWKSVSHQALAVVGIAANIFMWRNANNYWGETAEQMPLLHTWSLSVEEQFYFLYPLGLFLLVRFRRRWVSVIVISATVISLVLALVWGPLHSAASFYLLPTRAWELFVGCILADRLHKGMLFSTRWSGAIAGFGLMGLGTSYFIADHSVNLTCAHQMLACSGAALILAFSEPGIGFAGKVLAFGPIVFIGKISYSLYLWHWPVIVLGKHVGDFGSLALFAVSLIFATVTFFLIESPARHLANRPFLWICGVLSVGTIASLASPFLVERHGLAYAKPEFWYNLNLAPLEGIGVARIDKFEGDYRQGLILADRRTVERLDALVLGDSHSLMFFPAIKRSCETLNLKLGFYGAANGTSPFYVLDDNPADYYRQGGWEPAQRLEFDQCRRDFLVRFRPRTIFVCARWALYIDQLEVEELVRHIESLVASAPDSSFIFVGQPPELPFGGTGFTSGVLDVPPWRGFDENPAVTEARSRSHSVIRKVCNRLRRCRFVETESMFSGSRGVRFRVDEEMWYSDDDHLSVTGSLQCVSAFEQCLTDGSHGALQY